MLGKLLYKIINIKWYTAARNRARRRKSKLNFLLLLVCPLTAALWVFQVEFFYRLVKGDVCAEGFFHCLPHRGFGVTVFMVAPLFSSMLLAMLLLNAILRMIPSVRCVFDREAETFPETGYKNAQKALLKITVCVFSITTGLSLLGLYYIVR